MTMFLPLAYSATLTFSGSGNLPSKSSTEGKSSPTAMLREDDERLIVWEGAKAPTEETAVANKQAAVENFMVMRASTMRQQHAINKKKFDAKMPTMTCFFAFFFLRTPLSVGRSFSWELDGDTSFGMHFSGV